MSVNGIVEQYIRKELVPIMKQVIFNMSNITVNDSDIDQDFLINFFNQMKAVNYEHWKEVVKCGLEKFSHDNSIPVENIKDNLSKNTNNQLNNLVYECL
jgi:hypothetical protein